MPNRLVVALAYDRLSTFEFGIAVEIFGLPRPEMGPDWYRFAVCAIEPGPLRAIGGFQIVADGGLELLDQADTIVDPGLARGRQRTGSNGAHRGPEAGPCARRAADVHLLRRLRACRNGAPVGPAGDDALALCRAARGRLPRHQGRAGRALCGRGPRADLGGQRCGNRSLPACGARRFRARDRQPARPPPRRAAASRGRAGAVHRAARAAGSRRREIRSPLRPDARAARTRSSRSRNSPPRRA